MRVWGAVACDLVAARRICGFSGKLLQDVGRRICCRKAVNERGSIVVVLFL